MVVEELEKTKATLAKQEKLYVNCKKALASERSEVETLRLEVDQAESVIATLKDDLNTLQEKNNALKTRNEELEEQFSILWIKPHILRRQVRSLMHLLARVVIDVIMLI